MRDIRDDLQERVNFLAGQIKLAQGEFDKLIEQLKLEHDSKLYKLKSDLNAVHMVTGTEDRRLGSAPSASTPGPQPRPPQPPIKQVQPQQSHSDFLARKISAVGVR